MSLPTTPYFFISYSREDTIKQRRVVKGMRERGINVWVDIENLTPGTPTWEREIEKAIRGATGIIVLLSPESNNSEWVRRELSFGEQHRKRIFPALIEGNEDASTPLRLANHQRVDLRTNFEDGLNELANAVSDYIGVKQAIAIQSTPGSSLDIKKYGVPALIVMGLLAISGIIALVSKDIGETPTPIVVTTPPDADPVAIETTDEPPADEPTGKIIYTCQVQGDEICIINADGSNKRRLTNTSLANFNASLSPDGKKALYIVHNGTNSEIHELDVNNGSSKQLANLEVNLGSPEISPDNQFVVFHYRSGSNNPELWLMNRDGSDPHEFYSESGKDIHDATWSPDGTQILFALGLGEHNKLYVMDFNGREPQLLNNTIDTRGRTDWGIGGLIVLDMGDPFKHEVYLMNDDGSNLHQISPNGMNSQGASISPDGQWIAFTAYTDLPDDLNSCEIFIMRVDGSDLRQLTENNYCDYQPRWGN